VTVTGALGLLENCFQNETARTCDAIHDTEEAMAAAAGDVIPGEST
jgi:hypothetical protein